MVVRAHAAVRDSDIQANAIRYLAETGYRGISHGITWEKARLAVTYWSRIIVENKPERIYWWDNSPALDGPPAGSGMRHPEPSIRTPIRHRPEKCNLPPGRCVPGRTSPKMPWQAERRRISPCLMRTDIPYRCGHGLSSRCAKASGW